MNKDSVFNSISSSVDVVVSIRKFATNTHIALLVCLVAASGLLIFSYLRFDIARQILRIERHRRSVAMTFFSVAILNYDLLFFLFNIIAFNSIPCRTIMVTEKPASEVSYLEENSFENDSAF